MKRITRLDDVNINGPTGLESGVITNKDLRIGNIPGWNTMIDPEFPTPSGFLNQASGVAMQAALSVGEFDGGLPSIIPTSESQAIVGNTPLPTDAWTVFCVFSTDTLASQSPRDILRPIDTTGGSGDLLRLSINTSGNIILYTRSLDVRASVALPADGMPHVVVVTYSELMGVSMRLDGTEVDSNSSDKRKISYATDPGEYLWFSNSSNDASLMYGDAGVISSDLTYPSSRASLAALEGYLVEKYGITP